MSVSLELRGSSFECHFSKLEPRNSNLSFIALPVLQYLPRRIRPRAPRDPTTGMCSRAAQIQIPHRRPIPTPPCHRPHEQNLIECELAVVGMPLGKGEGVLQIARRQDLA